ncbi:AlbA family DNA-binding domain-containing protein [Hymenobacter terrenus]|uniref:AlbA family DNA-binding domain-containing protein n=1 Tax=Hymenobacter terrenus TaxID=1629124 RepID=UPI00061999F0|nr:ATP-binding protein [Hymenobacter terrenus]
MEYTPFSKSIEHLDIIEVNKLIDNKIGEGWYIEYKSKPPETSPGKLDNIKITKSISSFANTKGGWIFWGIECDRNEASEIKGFDISSYRNFQDQVSQIIASNINPKPIYHFKELKLNKDTIVFIIQVEESPTPPYITSQGIIYNRENNESKPIKERYIIENLNEKSLNYIKSIEDFSVFDLPQSKGQSNNNQAFLELYLFPKPFNHFEFKSFYNSEFFKKIAAIFYQNAPFKINNIERGIFLNIGFNSIYCSDESIVIRPLRDDNMIYKTTTVELFKNGNLKFLFPIHEFTADSIPQYFGKSKTIEYLLDKFSPNETIRNMRYGVPSLGMKDYELPPTTRRKSTDFANHVKLIDGAELILVIMIIMSKYKAVLEESEFELSTEINFRARITDSWRKFIFFEGDDYLEKLKIYNIPLSPKDTIEIPVFKN